MDFVSGWYKMAAKVHALAVRNGFWDKECNVGEKIALIHSELSEALEAERIGRPKSEVVDADSVAEELADTVIRIMDLAEGLGMHNLGQIIEEKHKYNESRPFRHGKAF